MKTLVFLLEELSAKELLRGLLPRLLPSDVQVQYLVFEGKQDLEKNISRKIRGWRAPNSGFVVLRDQDAGDCQKVRAKLVEEVNKSGRSALIRVACRQLEAWVLGDLVALGEVYERPDVIKHASKEKFRDPDLIHDPVSELRRLIPEYQKVDGARRVGMVLEPQRNASCSFRTFCSGLQKMLG